MRLELLRGANGMCITLDGVRITEPKIYGIMTPIQVWSVYADSIAEIIGKERPADAKWVHGHFDNSPEWLCSNCVMAGSDLYRFCPHCGARMDGG